MNTISIDKQNVKLIAHRGVSGLECENSCAAFVAAGNRSYFGIETDVHVTKDGKYVVIHDDRTGRVSDMDISVEESTFEELSEVWSVKIPVRPLWQPETAAISVSKPMSM